MTQPTLPHIYVQWTQSTEDPTTFLRYHIYRRRFGDTEWTLKKQVSDQTDTSWEDFSVQSGVLYEYDVTQIVDVAGDEVESAFSDNPAQVQLDWLWLFLHNVDDPGQYAAIPIEQQQLNDTSEMQFLTPYGRTSPTAFIGRRRDRTLSFNLNDSWVDTQEIWRALVELADEQRETAPTLLARQGWDVHMFCQLDRGLARSDARVMTTVGVSLREVYYSEAVEVE